MRLLYDSTTAADIPADAAMVAGYANGLFRWSDADWARFPRAIKIRIAVNAQYLDGHVLDVESGDALPSEAPGWVQARRAAGADPTVYCNRSNVDAIKAAFASANIPPPHLWLADYDNVAALPDGYVAKQYADQALIPGQPHYDLSVVADFWPGVDGEEDMAFKTDPDAQAFAADVKATFDAIKAKLALDAHHTHLFLAKEQPPAPIGGRTSEPLEPPFPGAAYFSASDDLTMIGWTDPATGKVRFYQNGTEITATK